VGAVPETILSVGSVPEPETVMLAVPLSFSVTEYALELKAVFNAVWMSVAAGSTREMGPPKLVELL
jgi:hypothetical protein